MPFQRVSEEGEAMSSKAKFWVALVFAMLIAAVTAFQVAVSDGPLTAYEWATVILAFLGAGAVWLVPNQTEGWGNTTPPTDP